QRADRTVRQTADAVALVEDQPFGVRELLVQSLLEAVDLRLNHQLDVVVRETAAAALAHDLLPPGDPVLVLEVAEGRPVDAAQRDRADLAAAAADLERHLRDARPALAGHEPVEIHP